MISRTGRRSRRLRARRPGQRASIASGVDAVDHDELGRGRWRPAIRWTRAARDAELGGDQPDAAPGSRRPRPAGADTRACSTPSTTPSTRSASRAGSGGRRSGRRSGSPEPESTRFRDRQCWCVRPGAVRVVVGPLAEQRATDPDDRRALLDGHLEVVGHAHRQRGAEAPGGARGAPPTARRSATNVGRAASGRRRRAGRSSSGRRRAGSGRARIDGEVRGDAGRREAGLGRVVGDVDLEQHRQRPPRPTLAGEAVEALGEREAVDRLDRRRTARPHGRPCWTGAGPTRCHAPPDVAGILSAASWTRFSPSTSSPASIADLDARRRDASSRRRPA